MKTLTSTLLCAAVALASFGAMAQDDMRTNKKQGSGPNPYTDCGIGAAIFQDVPWAAATSNATWDIGTTAVISATASPETCNAKDVEMAIFIQHSYDRLIEETAQGEGEYLNAMLNIQGCAAKARSQVVRDVRRATGEAVADASYTTQSRQDKVIQYYHIVDSTVSNHCPAS